MVLRIRSIYLVKLQSRKPDPLPQEREGSGELRIQALSRRNMNRVSTHDTFVSCLSSNSSLENSEREQGHFPAMLGW